MELMTRVSHAIQSSRGIESILHDIIELVLEIMNAQACSIYLYEDGLLRLKATKGLSVTDITDIKITLGEGITGKTALQKKPLAIRDITDSATSDVITGHGFEKYKSILSVPMLEGDNLVGVMNVRTIDPYDYSQSEKQFLTFVATQLVGAIRLAQLYEDVLRSFREMATLHQIGQILNSTIDLDELVQIVAQTCVENLSARGCIIRLIDTETTTLTIKGAYGINDEELTRKYITLTEGISGKAVSMKGPVFLKELTGDVWEFREVVGKCKSVICIPLTVKGEVIGTLGIYDKITQNGDTTAFEDEDVSLVTMIGNQIAMAIENARLYEHAKSIYNEKDMKIREMSLLFEITNIMRSSLDIEEVLYIILTSVTMGEGLGFNRSALFLTDDHKKNLRGMMAVGPLHAEDAARHWNSIDVKGKTLADIVREYGQFNMTAGFQIDKIIKRARIPIHKSKGILARTILERSTFNVTNYTSPEDSEERVLGDVGFTTFVSVPLIAKDNVVGCIVVDNLVTHDTITEDMVRFLQLFANQAAAAIETSKAHKSLEQSNKRLVEAQDLLVRTRTLATLGEFSAGVAHELRNPLVSIGGFAKRLARLLDDDTQEAHYARIIAKEVETLESILNQILEFVGSTKTNSNEVDMVDLIEQVLMLFNEALETHGIRLETQYDQTVRSLKVDEVQMRQLFINLIKNAIEAMESTGGTLRITSTKVEDGHGGVGFEVADSGVGIPADDLAHIFDPFFTKKETGTGLGLPICSRIVEASHGGRVFIDSKEGHGTSVLIWLPQNVIPNHENV